ncbi:MAG: hypothetical protein JW895_14040 [Thermoleophilaceae bacterium]|nr:hypothetical protein [Thermoleophilaceae bacterium]
MGDGDRLVRDPATGEVLGTIDELLERRRNDPEFMARLNRLADENREVFELLARGPGDYPGDVTEGPSIEIPADIDFLDNPGAAYADGKPLDLGEHGTQDPLARSPFDDDRAKQQPAED